jgi:two-component system LytT family response regulator
MIKAIIIDDEKTSRDALAGLLKRYCPQVEILDQADGVESAKEVIKKHEADVLFLDIQMPDGSGFKLLEEVGEELSAYVIFTTAFDQFAIKAIKYSALDYLLKPILVEELIASVKKLERMKDSGETQGNMRVLIENVHQKDKEPKKIVLSTSDGVFVIEVNDVIRCQSDNYYSIFHFTNGKHLLISKTLKESEELLQDRNFFRPHKSHLINIKHIKTYIKAKSTIILSDGTEIPVSRRKKEKVMEIIRNIE